MKIGFIKQSSNDKSQTIINLTPEDKEDLFTIYQIIDPDDEVIIKKMFTTKQEDSNKKTITDLHEIKLKVISYEFDIKDEYLRYKGVTIPDDTGVANKDISIGKFLSFSIHYTHPMTIYKHNLNKYAKRLLQDAENAMNKSEIGAVVLQEGIAHVCLLTSSSTIMKQKIAVTLPKKKNAEDATKFNDLNEAFYRQIYDAMNANFNYNELKVILLCSPGFFADALHKHILKFAEQDQNEDIIKNQESFLLANCSTGYLQGIDEVLKNPKYVEKLEDTKFVKDVKLLDQFMEHLDNDDNMAWYGRYEVFKAAKLDAIDTLLMTDTMLKSNNIAKREKYLDLIDLIEANGGKVFIFSTLHTSGEELNQLTGLACILKYAIPTLDERNEEDDISDSEAESSESQKEEMITSKA
ncbi:hypothetical protein C6P45_002539 [Maudiozyma exigua]|uniref:Protein DOM34 homolog n=1 Tax=Maudiozyma exigua TaxID=34358 RepID=A0A9P6VWI1_MAUEX|nr:hypothetical protein C6P45_002539 [Kazachstania exigua]